MLGKLVWYLNYGADKLWVNMLFSKYLNNPRIINSSPVYGYPT